MRLLFVQGGSRGLLKQAEPGLCRGGASPEIPPSLTSDRTPGVARLPFLPVPKDWPFAPETFYYLTVCRFGEKVIIADC